MCSRAHACAGRLRAPPGALGSSGSACRCLPWSFLLPLALLSVHSMASPRWPGRGHGTGAGPPAACPPWPVTLCPLPAGQTHLPQRWLRARLCAFEGRVGGRGRDIAPLSRRLETKRVKPPRGSEERVSLFVLRSTASSLLSVISELGCHYPFQKKSFLSIEIK